MPIHVEDLRKNQWVTISCCRDIDDADLTKDDWEQGNWWKQEKKQVVVEHPWITGAPLQIRAVGLPFVCVYNPNINSKFSLDTRVFGFTMLSDHYVKSMRRREPLKPGQIAGPIPCTAEEFQPKKKPKPDRLLCPECQHKLRVFQKPLDLSGLPGYPQGKHAVWTYECEACSFQGFRR